MLIRVLVTGATGFIGGAMLRRLTEDDRFAAIGSSRRNCSHLAVGDAKMVTRDVEPQTHWGEVLAGVQAIVHTAARVHVMVETSSDPLAQYRRVNVDGTLNLARQAAEAGVRRFVFLSSIKVNGEQTLPDRPYSAADNPAPIDPYGVSKLEAETGLMKISGDSGMELVIVRPALVYGPGVSANFLSMMRWIYRGVPLPLAGIDNKRSMIALDNLVDLLVHCLISPLAANKIVLAADGEDLSTTDLLIRTGDALSRPARLFWLPKWMLRGGAWMLGKRKYARRILDSLQLDASETQSALEWHPKTSVDDGLRKTVKAFLEMQR